MVNLITLATGSHLLFIALRDGVHQPFIGLGAPIRAQVKDLWPLDQLVEINPTSCSFELEPSTSIAQLPMQSHAPVLQVHPWSMHVAWRWRGRSLLALELIGTMVEGFREQV